MKLERLLVRQISTFRRRSSLSKYEAESGAGLTREDPLEHRGEPRVYVYSWSLRRSSWTQPRSCSPGPSCGHGKLLLLVYSGQQSQGGRHAGVELADYVDVKSLAVTLRNNG